jgi:formiminotetrahydrofolate cyclodeaminase
LDILNDCSKITEWNQLLVEHCNQNLISDIAVSSALIFGAIKATRINILINLKEIKDKEFIKKCLKEMDDISIETEKKAKIIIEKIENKIKDVR